MLCVQDSLQLDLGVLDLDLVRLWLRDLLWLRVAAGVRLWLRLCRDRVRDRVRLWLRLGLTDADSLIDVDCDSLADPDCDPEFVLVADSNTVTSLRAFVTVTDGDRPADLDGQDDETVGLTDGDLDPVGDVPNDSDVDGDSVVVDDSLGDGDTVGEFGVHDPAPSRLN